MTRERVISAFSRFSDAELCKMYSVKRAGCAGCMSHEGRLQRLGNYYHSRSSEIKAFLEKWATDPMDIDMEWEGDPKTTVSTAPLLSSGFTFNNSFNVSGWG